VELAHIDWLQRHTPPDPRLVAGIGDDAAVFAPFGAAPLVAAVDVITDLVDFRIAEVTPEQIGHKALGVNLSDLAAMAARPLAYLAALVLPQRVGDEPPAAELAQGIHRGMQRLATAHHVALAGGDTNTWSGPLAVSVTALGLCTGRGPLLRSGAQPGDWLLVTGPLGGSLLGRHLAVAPRVELMIALHAAYELHAAIDISDGLALDAARLATASACGVELDLAAIPVHDDAARMAQGTGRTPLDHALGDGEDFEILVAAPPAEAARMLAEAPRATQLTRVGQCVEEPGLWQRTGRGERIPLPPRGYQH
jgi:thiamine-monophosphate kinase